jgi:hypothetical protein
MERLKFLMFERGNLGNLGFPDCQVSLRNFSGMQEIVRLFLHRRDLFCAFLDLAKNALIPRQKQKSTKGAESYGGYSHNPTRRVATQKTIPKESFETAPGGPPLGSVVR